MMAFTVSSPRDTADIVPSDGGMPAGNLYRLSSSSSFSWNGLYAISNYTTIEEDDGIVPIEDTNVWEPAADNDSPGFEIIILFIAVLIMIYFKRKKIY